MLDLSTNPVPDRSPSEEEKNPPLLIQELLLSASAQSDQSPSRAILRNIAAGRSRRLVCTCKSTAKASGTMSRRRRDDDNDGDGDDNVFGDRHDAQHNHTGSSSSPSELDNTSSWVNSRPQEVTRQSPQQSRRGSGTQQYRRSSESESGGGHHGQQHSSDTVAQPATPPGQSQESRSDDARYGAFPTTTVRSPNSRNTVRFSNDPMPPAATTAARRGAGTSGSGGASSSMSGTGRSSPPPRISTHSNATGRGILANTMSRYPKASSPLSSPPIMASSSDSNNDGGKKKVEEEQEQEQEEDYFSPKYSTDDGHESPSIYLTRPEGDVDVIRHRGDMQQTSATSSYYHSRDGEDEDEEEDEEDDNRTIYSTGGGEESNLIPPPPQAHTRDDLGEESRANMLNNLFQMGLYSGGMAPGAAQQPADDGENIGDDLKERREALLKSLSSRSAPVSPASTTPSVGDLDVKEGDIPLLELDKKLSEVKEENEVAEYQDIAENLVRSHTLHRATPQNGDASRGYYVDTKDYYTSMDYNTGDIYYGDEDLHNNSYEEGGEESKREEDHGQDGGHGTGSGSGYGHGHGFGGFGNRHHHEDWIAPPVQVKQGVLGSLLKLYAENESQKSQSTLQASEGATPRHSVDKLSPTGTHKSSSSYSGSTRPTLGKTSSSSSVPGAASTLHPAKSAETAKSKPPKWYSHRHSKSMNSLGGLIAASSQAAAAPGAEPSLHNQQQQQQQQHHQQKSSKGGVPMRPKFTKRNSGGIKKKKKDEHRRYITVHIADVLQRQRFLLRMCRALMLYGAPTHRLEEYMKMSARVLEINGQFLYIPGCMLVSFGDPSTHTSEMQLVRCIQGLNLWKLHKAHTIYKEVLHDVINVEDASERIDQLLASKNQYPEWLCVLLFGLASSMVTPFAFGGWWPDLPMSFFLGGVVGVFQVVVAPRSELYNNVFEVSSSILVAFLSRAFGTIGGDEKIFCFSAVCQGSLAMILPGYMILTGSLELQSKNIVSGSVRMFYAVIYSVQLSFGITLGAAIYGWIDSGAVNDLQCQRNISPWFKFLFVPGYNFFVALVNQAAFRQLPVMIIIASAGYAVTFFTNLKVPGSSEFTSAIGAFVIGVMGNVYSRVGHGLAFAAMLPGIFSQLPGSVAAQGSLIAGLQNANNLVAKNNKTTILTTATVSGHVQTSTMVSTPPTASATAAPQQPSGKSDTNVLSLGMTMIQVCIGITVGLFAATLFIYPFGKKRSGLFTF